MVGLGGSVNPRARMAVWGSMGWPSRYRGHISVQKRHWSQADRPTRAICPHSAPWRRTRGWSRGRTMRPPVVLVMG